MMFRTDFMSSGNTVGVWDDDYIWQNRQMTGVFVRPQKTDAAPRPVRSMCVVNAAGAWAGELAELAHIGKGKGLMAVPIPVVKRKRYVYVVHCPEGPSHNKHVEEDALTDHSNLDVDYEFFYDRIWPTLAKRVPAFENLKIKSAWAVYNDYNEFDQNPIIGNNLQFKNFFQCCGFSGHGIQGFFINHVIKRYELRHMTLF